MQRAKDYMSGKNLGLAQATRPDPTGIARKAMGMAGAPIGGALAGGKPVTATTELRTTSTTHGGEQLQAGEQPAQGGPNRKRSQQQN